MGPPHGKRLCGGLFVIVSLLCVPSGKMVNAVGHFQQKANLAVIQICLGQLSDAFQAVIQGIPVDK